MSADDSVDDDAGDFSGLVIAVLELAQRGNPKSQACRISFVPGGRFRVEIPAVVVEAWGVGELADGVEVLAVELAKPDHHIGHLHTGVVDVVLGLDRDAAKPQEANEGVTEGGVSKMPDVGRFVRIDRRVLDDDLPLRVGGCGLGARGREAPDHKGRSIQVEIEVAAGCSGDP